MSMIGVPYAPAEYGDTGYAVRCPVCAETFSGSGKSETAITKSASRKYAAHYAEAHAT